MIVARFSAPSRSSCIDDRDLSRAAIRWCGSGAQLPRVACTNRMGTDVKFTFAKLEGLSLSAAERPGGYFVPGTVLLIPEMETVRGVIKCETVFHEYYTHMREPLSLQIDGTVREVSGEGSEARVNEPCTQKGRPGEIWVCGAFLLWDSSMCQVHWAFVCRGSEDNRLQRRRSRFASMDGGRR